MLIYSASSANIAVRFAAALSCLRSRAALVFARLASISSLRARSRCFSALARWIYKTPKVSYTVLISQECGTTYVLNETTLVLESVTLAAVVELVVEVLVDLAAGTVLDEKTSEDSETAHPEDLAGHTGIGGTLSLTVSTVSALSSSEVQLTSARSRVLGDGLSDDEAIGDELSDGLARVGVGDLSLLVGVEPDLALAAADDRGGQALLSSQIDPVHGGKKVTR